MSGPALNRLLREWAALVAVLALVLGPLALNINRSLGASEKTAIASGAKPFALCLPAGADPEKPAGGPDCDHCTSLQAFMLVDPYPSQGMPFASTTIAVAGASLSLRPFPRAPPARGPPAA